MLEKVILQAPIFLLVAIRCVGLLMTLPLFSMRAVPMAAKVALAGYMSFFLMNTVDYSDYAAFISGPDGALSIHFLLIAVGEGLIGVIIGFYISIIFAAFSSAGQFMAFQMGFSAASTYDSLSQVENPLLGQFFNFVAMLVFMQNQWFQRLFLGGLSKSFTTMTTISLIQNQQHFMSFLLRGLTKLFTDALIIALPIMGTLLLISICTGLLSKAAPQMNLMSEGFPIMILVSFFLILTLMPYMADFFVRSFRHGFSEIERLFDIFGGGGK